MQNLEFRIQKGIQILDPGSPAATDNGPRTTDGAAAAARAIISSRHRFRALADRLPDRSQSEDADEGGCGVTGFACNIPVSGRHIYAPSVQMHNRGNGKGGGIAAVGLDPAQLGVDRETLDRDFLLQVALLDRGVTSELEAEFIRPFFRVDHEACLDTVDDYRDVPGLAMEPPKVKRYFVRVKPEVLSRFQKEVGLAELPAERAEEEFICQNSFQINMRYYSSLGDKRAFVLSHGRNMMILKIVGYAEQVTQFYRLEDFKAHIWIAHQRYPTRGRVWHPGGAHPFIGLDEALVHNGDFANYYAVTQYLRQRNIFPLFLTDTEVSAQIFDLLNRVHRYPLEYIIESLAPTTEMDFDHLPEARQRVYRQIQAAHVHGSPDGPWFFIIARNMSREGTFQLIGITDTAMLRPQVFALQKGEVQIGLICSEKQAIDATLQSLAQEDPRFGTVADRYWNARGGSYTDGGAFIFTVKDAPEGDKELVCTDKFGREIDVASERKPFDFRARLRTSPLEAGFRRALDQGISTGEIQHFFPLVREEMGRADYSQTLSLFNHLVNQARDEDLLPTILQVLTEVLDRRYPTGEKRRRSILQMASDSLDRILRTIPVLNGAVGYRFSRLDFEHRNQLRAPEQGEEVLVVDARDFPPEGDDCDARLICQAYERGWRRFIGYGYRGQRFLGCGLGPETHGVRIDAYGNTGDYLGSGMDGIELHVHGNGQDQLGQILKSGRLVVHGDVGQTFMYGAKGGEVYVLGNAAGRPLINGVGRPRVVINGTALDFLAESFMAGDPYNGGGFLIVNGLTVGTQGDVTPLATPYPGSNIFSLASGGAIFIRDSGKKIVDEQLNGGELLPFTEQDWDLVLPYLQENERIFGISIEEHLLQVDGERRPPAEVYRTIRPKKTQAIVRDGLEEWE
jgi:glutamate synthase domain-containing protein 1/glutamate synthase domain-containing protein 3